jgi:hypothetical protein
VGRRQSPAVGLPKSRSLALSPITPSAAHLSDPRLISTPLSTRNENPVSIYVNGTPAYLHRSITTTTACAHSPVAECSSCIYQDVIVARALAGTISPLPEITAANSHLSGSELLGTPASSSTPKKSFSNLNRLNLMKKIDNFESLNKNFKSLDSNNNSNECGGSPVSVPTNRNQLSKSTSSSTKGTPSTSSRQGSRESSRGTIVVIQEEDVAQPLSPDPLLSPPINELRSYTSQSSKVFVKNSPKWRSLPRGFRRVAGAEVSGSGGDLIVRSHFDNDSMRLWLHELRLQAEPECLVTLQVKSIAALVAQPESGSAGVYYMLPPRLPKQSVSIPLISIRNVERVASIVSEDYSRICR